MLLMAPLRYVRAHALKTSYVPVFIWKAFVWQQTSWCQRLGLDIMFPSYIISLLGWLTFHTNLVLRV